MRSIPLALVVLAAPAAVADTVHAPILGGTPTTVGQYPNVVAIEVGGGLCTGTLIAPDWVLTAAHCVSPTVLMLPDQAAVTSSARVHFNTVNVFSQPGMSIGASETIPDPQFNINALGSHDSGLIHLSTPVTNITPVTLNLDATKAPVGITVTMVGFGATAVGGGGNVGVEYVVQQTSISCSGGEGSDLNLLCFNQVDGKGKCEGDSGGPSFATIDGKAVEVGITSFGDQSCSQFGADTRVDAEAAFIKSHVPLNTCMVDTDCASGHECFENRCIVMPFQPGGVGSTCTAGSDCDTGLCAAGDGTMKCSMSCTVGQAATCPTGLDCIDAGGGAGACWPPATGGGCCDASGAGAPTMLLGIGLIGLVLRRRRR